MVERVTRRIGWRAAVLLPLLLGLGLRLRYVLRAEPFVDEPTTMLAAQAIARTGWPTLPSGLFYGNDLPFSYLAGGLVALLGPHLVAVRLLSLAASGVCIGLVYRAGRTLFQRTNVPQQGTDSGVPPAPVAQAQASKLGTHVLQGVGSPWVGLWAATLLALDPAAILWGGRARAYALLGLLALAAVWLFYTGAVADRKWLRRLGLLLLMIAVYVHPEASLLLPALVVATVAVQGLRWWRRGERLAELLAATVVVGSRWWWQVLLARGRIGAFETMTGSRPPVELSIHLVPRLKEVLPFFTSAEHLPWTALALLALAGAAWWIWRRRCTGDCQAVLFFSACLWLVPIQMILFLGSSYQSPRYLTMLLPVFALMAASGLGWAVTAITSRGGPGGRPLAGLATAVMLAACLPAAWAAANSQEKGFGSAFEVVKQQWRAGDRVATVAPAYSQMVLERCDFFTLGLDYEEFVYRAADGRWVDRWLGKPLIRSAEELAAALDQGGRLWFVTDESRLRNRFDAAFAQRVWQRMELVSKSRQVLVFRSSDWPDTACHHPLNATFGGQVELVAYDLGLRANRLAYPGWGEVVASAGEALPLVLYWQAVSPATMNYSVFVHLVGQDGQRYAQADGPPLNGLHAMTDWLVGEVLPDRRVVPLPANIPPGRYRLEVGLYTLDGGDRLPVTSATGQPLGEALTLDYVTLPGSGGSRPSPAHSLQVDLEGGNGDRVRLLGYTLAQPAAAPGSTLRVTLYWQAPAALGADYTVFLHLLDRQGAIRGQGDGPPVAGFYPCSRWDAGEIIVDEHKVEVDADAPPGIYRLAAGLYLPSTGERLVGGDGDRVLLGEVQVKP